MVVAKARTMQAINMSNLHEIGTMSLMYSEETELR